ncbi:MAG: iron-sulfur cluster assembly accessory protein [Bdellovibrionales bacterium]|nr:iron-sulfur cluster assembly accessory protein [Bdellovibrionales bacterium]
MITVTDKAFEAIEKLQKQQNDPLLSLRLGVRGGGCSGFSYQLDLDHEAKDTDHVFEKNGIKVLVDPKSMKFLEGLELDYFESLTSRGFRFNNPKAKSTCGCGSSFALE